jgi:hypothetical protein
MTDKCSVCGGPAGDYRLGACSPGCDRVVGDETLDWIMVALGLTILLIVIVLSVMFNPAGCTPEFPC